jgi:hypothetical protein
MRYRTNERRLELEVAGSTVEELVLAVYSLVVPRYTRKLYFVPESACSWPKLVALAGQRMDFKVIPRDE